MTLLERVAFLCFFSASLTFAVTNPTLPKYQVDTTFPTVTGKSIPVSSGQDLQAAINAANPGDELVLQAGGSWTGNYTLPNKGVNSAWIVIRSSALSNLPTQGNRVSPKDAANMPKIMASGVGTAFSIAAQANHYRLVGLEITEQPKQWLNYGLIMMGDPNDTNAADLPSYFVIDRCYLHGLVLSHIKFGVQFNGSYMAAVDSYFSEFHGLGQDTQAITGYMGTGPLKIVNNFLEGSGENILFGGAWDAIPNTTTADVTFTNNYLYKPLAWMQSVIPPPSVSALSSIGGILTPGTYYYAVIAQGTCGTLTDPGSCQSARSKELSMTLTTGQNAVALSWNNDTYGDAADTRTPDSYVVARTQNAPGLTRNWTYYQVSGTSLTDTGSLTPLGSYNEWPRYWDVKNLFEIKNGVRWLVDSNVMEGNWLNAQNGFSILFTPRNETPFMPGNRISDITFTNNVIRHVAGGINLASEDDSQPSADWPLQQPTARMSFVNNLFEDVNWKYNGNGQMMEIEPGAQAGMLGVQDVTFDHNTTSMQTGNYNSIGNGGPLNNYNFTNNIFEEGSYGWFVSGLGQSYSAITQEIQGLNFTGNVWAGNPAAYQIAGNFFPSDMSGVGFVNWNGGNGGDYHLALSSPYKGKATDGTDPGANIDMLNTVLSQVLAGSNPNMATIPSSPSPAPAGSPTSTTPDSTGTPPAVPASSPTNWYEIVALNSQKCLTMQSDQTVKQFACDAKNTAQQFSFVPVAGGVEFFSRVEPGYGLNVWGAGTNNGALIGLYQLTGARNEIFAWHPDHAGHFVLTPQDATQSCVDITGASNADGVLLEQWACNGGTNQSFSFSLVDQQ